MKVWCSDAHGEFGGLNCLIERQALTESAKLRGLDENVAQRMLAEARKTLHEIRAERPRPHLDDKVASGLAVACILSWIPCHQQWHKAISAAHSHGVHSVISSLSTAGAVIHGTLGCKTELARTQTKTKVLACPEFYPLTASYQWAGWRTHAYCIAPCRAKSFTVNLLSTPI